MNLRELRRAVSTNASLLAFLREYDFIDETQPIDTGRCKSCQQLPKYPLTLVCPCGTERSMRSVLSSRNSAKSEISDGKILLIMWFFVHEHFTPFSEIAYTLEVSSNAIMIWYIAFAGICSTVLIHQPQLSGTEENPVVFHATELIIWRGIRFKIYCLMNSSNHDVRLFHVRGPDSNDVLNNIVVLCEIGSVIKSSAGLMPFSLTYYGYLHKVVDLRNETTLSAVSSGKIFDILKSCEESVPQIDESMHAEDSIQDSLDYITWRELQRNHNLFEAFLNDFRITDSVVR